MKQVKIRITEDDLKNIISESVKRYLEENQCEEGWFGDKFNQAKSAANTMFNKDGGNLASRFQSAKKNWGTQGELNDINNLKNALSKMIDNRQINPNMTIAQLVGGKYNGGKFGSMTGIAANRMNQIKRRGGKAFS